MKRNEFITWSESPYDTLPKNSLEKLLYMRGLPCAKDTARKKLIFQLLKDDTIQRERRLKENQKIFVPIQAALRGYQQRKIFEKEKVILKEIYSDLECEELHFQNKSLIRIPDIISECINLKELNFSKNLISVCPSFINELRNLKILNLSYNLISEIPYEINELNELENLNLSHNNLSEFPYDILELENLKIINLSFNLIQILPFEVSFMNELVELNITNNQLKDIPDSILELKNLKKLEINGNIPENIEKFNEIETKFNPDFKLNKKKNRLNKIKQSQHFIEKIRYSSNADSILNSFLENELLFKNELEIILNYFYFPLKKEIKNYFSKDEFNLIFDESLINIIKFTQNFFSIEFSNLREFLEEFKRNIIFLNFYISYASIYSSSIQQLKFNLKNNVQFKNWYVMTIQNSKRDLYDLLELPLNSIKKYLNFFDSLINNLSNENQSYNLLIEIYETLKIKSYNYLDSLKIGNRKTLGRELILEFSDTLSNENELILEGIAMKGKEKVELYLFDEYIIIKSNNDVEKIKLKQCNLYSENLGNDESQLILKSIDNFYELKFENSKISFEWKKKVLDLIFHLKSNE
eukprot:gene5363-9171_t